jgi:hypothetical protein
MTRIFITAALVLVAVGPTAAQQPQPGPHSDAKVAALLAAWEKKRESMPPIRYVYKQEYYWPERDVLGEKQKERRYSESHELLFDWKTGRYRRLVTEPSSDGGLVRWTITYDGVQAASIRELLLANGTPKPDAPRKGAVTKGKLEAMGTVVADALPPYLTMSILPIPGSGRHSKSTLFPEISSDQLYYAHHVVVGGTGLDVYRTYPFGQKGTECFAEITVDPKRDAVVTKYAVCSGATLGQLFTLDYVNRDGRWLPSGWTFEEYSSRRLFSRYTAKVDSGAVESITDSSFTTTFEEGMSVTLKTVTVEPGKAYHSTSEELLTQRDGELASLVATSGGRWRWFWLLIPATLSVAGYLLYRVRWRTTVTGGSP